MVYSIGQLVQLTKENGRMIDSMVMEHLSMLTVMFTKVIGKMILQTATEF